jgi:plastocyanin
MRAFLSTALFLFAFAIVPAACSSPAAKASAPDAAAPTAPVVIHMHDFMFDPDTVTIAPGQTVEFDNDDGARHTVTATDKSFDSGDLKPGAKWSHVFASAGTFTYGCTQHPQMTGTINVKAP